MGIKQDIGKALSRIGQRIKSAGETFYSLTDRSFPRYMMGTYGTSSPKWLEFRTREDYVKAWEQCPPLASILINKAQADINGCVQFRYQGTKEPVKIPYNGAAKKLKKLFSKPNPLQTWRQFRAQQKIYQQLFGFCPVLVVKPAGFNDPLEATAMWNLPPQYVKIHTSGKLLYATTINDIIDKFEFVYNNKTATLEVNDVILLNDQGISLTNEVVPDSRIRSLAYVISNVAAIFESLNVLITKRGALGILTNRAEDQGGAIGLTPTQKKELQDDFKRYGLTKDQWQVIITNAQLEWQQMAMPVKDLMLLETLAASTQQLCDTYGYPFELVGNIKGVTFANKQQAKVMLYQDTIKPEGDADFEVYNQYFGLLDKDSDTAIEMYYSFDHVEALQQSAKDKAVADKTAAEAAKTKYESGAITLNRMREMLGEATVAGDDTYYSKPVDNGKAQIEQDPKN